MVKTIPTVKPQQYCYSMAEWLALMAIVIITSFLPLEFIVFKVVCFVLYVTYKHWFQFFFLFMKTSNHV